MLALAAVIVWPRLRVARILAAENRVMDTLETWGAEVNAFRTAVTRDRDGDGVGEVAALTEILGRAPDGATLVAGSRVLTRHGYYLALFAPGLDRRPISAGDDAVPVDHAEASWLLAAWPVKPGSSGMRAYLRTPVDGTLRDAVDGYPYGGADRAPVPDVALVSSTPQGLRAEKLRGKRWVPPREQRGTQR